LKAKADGIKILEDTSKGFALGFHWQNRSASMGYGELLLENTNVEVHSCRGCCINQTRSFKIEQIKKLLRGRGGQSSENRAFIADLPRSPKEAS